jgi:cytochrome P450
MTVLTKVERTFQLRYNAEVAAPYFDPYDVDINADPYPVYEQLRDEAPVYRNDRYGFWALSRHADVERALVDWAHFSSARSDILEVIQADVPLPPGVIMFEDPPAHTAHRGLMSRVFTPKRMAALEDQVRQYCARCLDPLVGSSGFDIIAELAAELPMRVIGMLLGIPESDQVAVRDRADANLRTRPGEPMRVKAERITSADMFHDYIEWRAAHPSDDLMTVLLNAELEDEHGETRRLTREEVHQYTAVLAGAGNETTGRLIGWLAKLLAEHPDQRRQVREDRSLIPRVVDEALRFEPTGHAVARYVVEDVELHGTTIPAGSAVLLLVASANRDPRRYANPDAFDIHRDDIAHLTFGFGLHFCLGASLARLEGRVALDELLDRFPEWDIDRAGCQLAPTSTVRGWARMPLVLP